MKLMKTLATAAVLVGLTMNVGMAEAAKPVQFGSTPGTPVEPAFVAACPVGEDITKCRAACRMTYKHNVEALPKNTLKLRLVEWFKSTGIPAADKAVGECKTGDAACDAEKNAMLNDQLDCCKSLNIVNGEMTQCR